MSTGRSRIVDTGAIRRRLAGGLGIVMLVATMIFGPAAVAADEATPATAAAATPTTATPDLLITSAEVRFAEELDVLVFDIDVEGTAGGTLPTAQGNLDGAPVLGYVVLTTLLPSSVGFRSEEGTVALAVTAHPDFDDTPLWDESADGDYLNDGGIWHAHWALVGPDERVPGGLAVLDVVDGDAGEVLPPTNPGLPIYFDSPGFPVTLDGDSLRVVVPTARVGGEQEFNFDAATVYLQVNTSDPDRPLLGVYDIYGVLSGDVSLPYEVVIEE